jgi:hypothetical protein
MAICANLTHKETKGIKRNSLSLNEFPRFTLTIAQEAILFPMTIKVKITKSNVGRYKNSEISLKLHY